MAGLHDVLGVLELSPADAESRGIEDGDEVRIRSRLGEIVTRCRVSDRLPPSVASLPKGLWIRHTVSGGTANALTPDALTDLGGGACFSDVRVEVQRNA